jgi:hypothetical protein
MAADRRAMPGRRRAPADHAPGVGLGSMLPLQFFHPGRNVRLAASSKVLAAEALAPMMARLSIGRSQQSDNVAIARRLLGLPPIHGHAAAPPSPELADAGVKKYVHAIMLLVCLALAAPILSGML